MLKRLGSSKGVVMVLLAAAAVCGGLVYLFARERGLNTELTVAVAALRGEQVKLGEVKARLEQTLKDTQVELETANTKNYRVDMVTMQDAAKEANQKLGKMIHERAELENTNFLLESRLANTTKELTRSFEELTQLRTLFAGTENPHQARMVQLSEDLKGKEQEAADLRKRLEEMERALIAYRAQGKDVADGAQRYQERMEIFSRNIADLRTELVEKNRQLIQKDAEIDNLRREVVQARTVAEQEEAAKAAVEMESQRQSLAQQIAASQGELKNKEGQFDDLRKQLAEVRERLYDREASFAEIEARRQNLEQQISASQEQLKGRGQQLDVLQREVGDLREKLQEREALLNKVENEAEQARRDAKALENEVAALRSEKSMFSKGTSELAKVRSTLDEKIRELERENAALEKELALVERRTVSGDKKKEDPFRDRNLRLMTEQLVKKEEEIRRLTDDVAALTKEKGAWEKSFGPREKHMAELEILVNTLTRQLGDYSAMIEKRDVELRARAKENMALSEDLEAQKIAALALQKEFAEARARQEQTLQKLTQLMSMNTDGVGPDDMKFDLYGPTSGIAARQEKPEDPSKVRNRVDKLKRQVEVLMERR